MIKYFPKISLVFFLLAIPVSIFAQTSGTGGAGVAPQPYKIAQGDNFCFNPNSTNGGGVEVPIDTQCPTGYTPYLDLCSTNGAFWNIFGKEEYVPHGTPCTQDGMTKKDPTKPFKTDTGSGTILCSPVGGGDGYITISSGDCPQGTVSTNISSKANAAPIAPRYYPLEPIPGIYQLETGRLSDFGPLVNGVYKLLIGLGAMFAVLTIVYYGIAYMVTASIGRKNAARGRLVSAVTGLLILICTYLILYTINPQLTQQSLNLPPLSNKNYGSTSQAGVNKVLCGNTISADGDCNKIIKGDSTCVSSADGSTISNTGCYSDAAIQQSNRNEWACKNIGGDLQMGMDTTLTCAKQKLPKGYDYCADVPDVNKDKIDHAIVCFYNIRK